MRWMYLDSFLLSRRICDYNLSSAWIILSLLYTAQYQRWLSSCSREPAQNPVARSNGSSRWRTNFSPLSPHFADAVCRRSRSTFASMITGEYPPTGVHIRRDATTSAVTDVIIQQRVAVRHRVCDLLKGNSHKRARRRAFSDMSFVLSLHVRFARFLIFFEPYRIPL